MKVDQGIEMLEISAVVMGRVNVIYPTLMWDQASVILVDTGYPGQLPLIRTAVEQARVPFDKLDKVILTHQDIDHIGNLPTILKESPRKVEVMATELEKPYIQGDRRLLKMRPEVIDQAVKSLPAEMPEERNQAFRAALENPPKAQVDTVIADGEELPFCGGISVIITPGHTPGHACLYHRPSRTLIAGDALSVVERQLQGPDPRATPDMQTALASLKKLAPFDIARVICYHGGLYQADVNQRIAALAGAQ